MPASARSRWLATLLAEECEVALCVVLEVSFLNLTKTCVFNPIAQKYGNSGH